MDSRSILRFPSVCMYNHAINIQHYHTKALSKPSFLVQAPRHARHIQGFLNNSAKSIGLLARGKHPLFKHLFFLINFVYIVNLHERSWQRFLVLRYFYPDGKKRKN